MYPWLIFFLPLGGIMIILLYHLLHDEKDTGTNLVLSAIHSGDEIPLRMAPLIFISTLITHLFGGSAGREGAALQFGASLGNWLGRKIHLNESDKRIMTLAGMSAAFAALFGVFDCVYNIHNVTSSSYCIIFSMQLPYLKTFDFQIQANATLIVYCRFFDKKEKSIINNDKRFKT